MSEKFVCYYFFISFAEKLIQLMSINRQIEGRIVWLDWMKVLAIFSIIWGHFFLLDMYIYMCLVLAHPDFSVAGPTDPHDSINKGVNPYPYILQAL